MIDVYNRLNSPEKMKNSAVTQLMNDDVVKELNDKVDVIRNKIISLE